MTKKKAPKAIPSALDRRAREIATNIKAEAEWFGVDPHVLLNHVKVYITLPPSR